MSPIHRIGAALGAMLVSCAAFAQEPGGAPDRVEAVQRRAWAKKGSVAIEPFGAYAMNDPFLVRGGGGVRGLWWPRSLVGLSLEVGAFRQAPSEAAIVAQRELRARMRTTGSGWLAMAGAEISAADGKLAFGSRIVPFELFLKGSFGAASSTEDLRGHPVAALGGGLGLRWFVSGGFGIETGLAVRTASLVREVDGKAVSSRDTVVALEVGVPLHVGGGK